MTHTPRRKVSYLATWLIGAAIVVMLGGRVLMQYVRFNIAALSTMCAITAAGECRLGTGQSAETQLLVYTSNSLLSDQSSYLLGILHAEAGRTSEAVPFLVRSERSVSSFLLGDILWDRGEADAAIHAWRKAGAGEHFFRVALRALEDDDRVSALNALRLSIRIDNTPVSAHLLLFVRLSLQDGDLASVEEVFPVMMPLLENNHEWALLRAEYALAKGNWVEAESWFERAVDLRRAMPHADAQTVALYSIDIGNRFRAAGAYDQAYGWYERAKRISPSDYNSVVAAHGLGLLFQGRTQDAVSLLRQAALEYPDDARIRRLFGAALSSMGEYAAAIEQYGIAVDLEPDNAILALEFSIALECNQEASAALDWERRAGELGALEFLSSQTLIPHCKHTLSSEFGH